MKASSGMHLFAPPVFLSEAKLNYSNQKIETQGLSSQALLWKPSRAKLLQREYKNPSTKGASGKVCTSFV
jgi:hypothetical protein